MPTKPPTPSKTAPRKQGAATHRPPPSKSPAAQSVPLPVDPSAARLQEEQDELQRPGRVARAVADQIDNDPGYSQDQLDHMAEYWSHGDTVDIADDE